MKNYTVIEVSELIGCNDQTVRRACKKLHVKKFGTAYYIVDADLKQLKNEISAWGVKKSAKK